MQATVFTRILARELPAAIVHEDAATFAFMDAGQLNPGHVLVATKQPFETLLDIDEDTAAALGVSPATVNRQWRRARAWLFRELAPPGTLDVAAAGRP